jgi:hypothetical protein
MGIADALHCHFVKLWSHQWLHLLRRLKGTRVFTLFKTLYIANSSETPEALAPLDDIIHISDMNERWGFAEKTSQKTSSTMFLVDTLLIICFAT